MTALMQKIDKAVSFIRAKIASSPRRMDAQIGLILGSGLGDFTDSLKNQTRVSFREIPEFPLSTVEGHEGAFVFGEYCPAEMNYGIPVVTLRGRLHYYEGYSQQETTLPVRIMKKLGVKTLLITNAAGGVNLDFSAGVLMLINDHINFSGANPLLGANLDEFGPRFPDASEIYSKDLRVKLKDAALKNGIDLREGVYLMASGPNYETPAEVRFFRAAGADAVGMSTVPEALAASHSGLKVIGISCITNMASGILDRKLDHLEVIDTANKVKNDFTRLLQIAINIANENLP